MGPVALPYPPSGNYREESRRAIARKIERFQTFLATAEVFLSRAYPHVEPGVIRDMRLAFETMETADLAEQLVMLTKPPQLIPGGPQIEDLMKLTEKRDELKRLLEKLETETKDMPSGGQAFAELSINFLRDQIEAIEHQITFTQTIIERGSGTMGVDGEFVPTAPPQT